VAREASPQSWATAPKALVGGGYGASVAERLFLFTQLELPWELGPPDGRYLLRSRLDREPEWVVVLGTLAAGTAHARSARRGSGPLARRRPKPASPEPATVRTSRATVIDPVSLPAEHQAQAWLAEIDAEREVESAVTVINRVLHAYRIAAADPYVHEVSATQALVIRAGFGEGERVADGNWRHARELPAESRGRSFLRRRRRVRDAALRPQERLAELLAVRHRDLVCEELTLRARLDLDQGRTGHAAIQLDAALSAAVVELRAEGREDLALRIDELDKLRAGVARRAAGVLPVPETPAHTAGASTPAGDPSPRSAASEEGSDGDDDAVRHALARLEAALRARTATGFGR